MKPSREFTDTVDRKILFERLTDLITFGFGVTVYDEDGFLRNPVEIMQDVCRAVTELRVRCEEIGAIRATDRYCSHWKRICKYYSRTLCRGCPLNKEDCMLPLPKNIGIINDWLNKQPEGGADT